MIHDVVVTPLRQIADQRGKVMHMLRSDAIGFAGFGEIYFSCVNAGAVKAWNRHRRMVCNYAVPSGQVRLVLYDARPDSPTRGAIQEIVMGDDNYCLVTIPPMIWSGFKGLGAGLSILANCASIPHDPTEGEKLDPLENDIPFSWD
jgi:dTDP-4-dehydrorhamnose 3,5-epimerase